MAYYLSAYAIAVAHGFRGSEEEWQASLRGAPGKSAYEVAVECGYQGTKEEWLESLKGQSDLPVAAAAAPTGYDTYAAAGDNLPVVQKASGQTEAVGVGKQIVFLPSRANLTTAPVLKLNNGETVEVRLRADGETADTVPVPVGALKTGVPVTLTFGGTYWLVDSAIGGLGGGNAERVELTQPVTIGETECDNVQDALEAAADALEGKIDEEDVEEVPFVTASDALQQVANDTAPITPAGVKRIVDEYGGDAQNIKVFDLDTVSSTALAALSDNPKTAVFLAYNVAEFEEEENVYPYGNKLLLLPLNGFEPAPLIGSLNAVFEQDADLARYSDDDPPVAQTVRRAVRVSISRANGSASDVKTVEITETQIDKTLPPVIHVETTESWSVPGAPEWAGNSTESSKGDFITRSGVLYICVADSTAGTWTQRKSNYKAIRYTYEERNYDAAKTYNVGDKCYYSASAYDQHMYVCKADSTTGSLPTDTSKWQDLGPVFAPDGDYDYRKYEDAANAGLCRIALNEGTYTTTTTTTGALGNNQKHVEFAVSHYNGRCGFTIIYDASTGQKTNIFYAAHGYATE